MLTPYKITVADAEGRQFDLSKVDEAPEPRDVMLIDSGDVLTNELVRDVLENSTSWQNVTENIDAIQEIESENGLHLYDIKRLLLDLDLDELIEAFRDGVPIYDSIDDWFAEGLDEEGLSEGRLRNAVEATADVEAVYRHLYADDPIELDDGRLLLIE